MRMMQAILLALLTAVMAAPAVADQKDVRLEGLFETLQKVPDARAAQPIEIQIWDIWYENDDSAIEELMRQGRFAMGRRDFASALRSVNQVIALVPDYAEGWNLRATLHYLMGNYEDSLADIEETLAREPRHFGALSGRGLVYAVLEELELALLAFEAALKVNPQMTGPRTNAEAIRQELKAREI